MQEVLPVERLVRDAKRSETIVRRSQLAHSRRVAARTVAMRGWRIHSNDGRESMKTVDIVELQTVHLIASRSQLPG
jgi:hypothetical protein